MKRSQSEDLRWLARRLQERYAAPSLDGYALVDGLIAAADLIDGLPGPLVHVDMKEDGGTGWPSLTRLRELL